MKTLLILILSANLFWIAYQDFKSREILIVSYLSLFAICISYLILFYEKPNGMIFAGNGLVLSLLGLGITSIYTIKKKKKEPIWNMFGLGDVLILLSMAIVSHTSVLLFLIISSSFFSIVLQLFNSKKEKNNLPFAGYFSLTSIALIIILLLSKNSFLNEPLFYTIFDV